jgi:protein-S-isoprenylcysteine O-methyltransferase Ste14
LRLISPARPDGPLLAVGTATSRFDTPGVVTTAPRLYGIAFVAGLLANGLQPRPLSAFAAAPVIGVALLGIGGAFAIWARRTMQTAGTNVNPRLPATALVVTGPFRFTRNPLYLARTILYIGLASAMNVAWPLVTLIPLLATVHYAIIKREEHHLGERFGDEYRAYCARVPRWL